MLSAGELFSPCVLRDPTFNMRTRLELIPARGIFPIRRRTRILTVLRLICRTRLELFPAQGIFPIRRRTDRLSAGELFSPYERGRAKYSRRDPNRI
jgi:hypothetical protein